ncbi:right-handed parallel beta-helix repeat-containing protein [Haloplanus salinarum]|uniref:right-handed parallel beta-helix repeat-containing protein n=1 Tax=Haloplanus salinarum TaxID=1912324 RepID=UPI00214BC0A4|nr:right-handed parallel beta-helix repeat-containing protein [Haloplanus salinarum]
MTLDIQDFVDQASGQLTVEDIPPNVRQRLNGALADLTGEEGGPSGPAGDLYDAVVNADGSGDYTSIQNAIDNVDSGSVISVESGSYSGFDITTDEENNKDDITLFGPNAGVAGDGDRGAEATVDSLVAVDATGVTIDGFALEREASGSLTQKGVIQVGAVGKPADGTTIANNVITPNDNDGENASLGGVAIESADDVTISDNVISPADASADTIGITRYVSNIENLTVSDNVIETELGIAFGGTDATDKPLSYSASITGNQFDTNGYCLAVYESESLDVTVTGNDFSDGAGIFVFSVDREDVSLPTPSGDGEKIALSPVKSNNTFDTTGGVTTTSAGANSTYLG